MLRVVINDPLIENFFNHSAEKIRQALKALVLERKENQKSKLQEFNELTEFNEKINSKISPDIDINELIDEVNEL